MKKLLVVDDSELIRHRLVRLLQGLPGVKEIGTAENLWQALYTALHFQPDLIVLDLNLPDGNAVRIIPKLRRIVPDVRIAVLSNDADPYSRDQCQQAGADWFFDKSTEFEQLLSVLRQQAASHY